MWQNAGTKADDMKDALPRRRARRRPDKPDRISRILVVVAEMGHNSQREISGITAWAKENGWAVDVVEGSHFGGTPDFAKWIGFWNPDGMVVDPLYAAEALSDKAAAGVPLVVWDAAAAPGLPERCARAMSDPAAIADAATRELLSTGFRHFAFVPAFGAAEWSRERGAAFAHAVAAFGRPSAAFSPPEATNGDAKAFVAELSRFLSGVQRPFGVFAANDVAAVMVRNACQALGLRIPQDVAIIGVDDHLEYCERNEPTLTSVRVDIEGGGRAAAALLAGLARRRSRRHGLPQDGGGVARYGVERVVRRASTRVLNVLDGRVSRALEWIRQNALRPIRVGDVVAVMGCSRRLADLRFRQATGHTVLDEIHARRLDEAMELLRRPDIPINDIPARCGYVPGPYLGILFRRATGATMRQWRRNALRT